MQENSTQTEEQQQEFINYIQQEQVLKANQESALNMIRDIENEIMVMDEFPPNSDIQQQLIVEEEMP